MSEWISVRDELPYGEDHLLYVEGGRDYPAEYTVGYFNRLTNCWMVSSMRIPGLAVSHWMPLPKPPKGE